MPLAYIERGWQERSVNKEENRIMASVHLVKHRHQICYILSCLLRTAVTPFKRALGPTISFSILTVNNDYLAALPHWKVKSKIRLELYSPSLPIAWASLRKRTEILESFLMIVKGVVCINNSFICSLRCSNMMMGRFPFLGQSLFYIYFISCKIDRLDSLRYSNRPNSNESIWHARYHQALMIMMVRSVF